MQRNHRRHRLQTVLTTAVKVRVGRLSVVREFDALVRL
jgi:hypothetical protein